MIMIPSTERWKDSLEIMKYVYCCKIITVVERKFIGTSVLECIITTEIPGVVETITPVLVVLG